MYEIGGHFITGPPLIRLIWFLAYIKILPVTNFSENFMFISFKVLEKTVVDFEKKSKTIFSKIVSFRNDEGYEYDFVILWKWHG